MTPPWVDRLERRAGFLALPGLAAFLASMNAVVGLLSLFRPDFPFQLTLDAELVRAGQAWRLLTFVFVPPELGLLWLLLWLALYYGFLQLLENAWGDFKLTLYCLLGLCGHAAASLLLGQDLANGWFNASLFLAFARLHPELEIRVFFILPVRMKWLAALTGVAAAADVVLGGPAARAAVAAGLVNYALYFGPDHWRTLRRSLKLP